MAFMKNTPTRRSKKRGTKLNAAARLEHVLFADKFLRTALMYAKWADAPALAGRIRAALKSAEGAVRHARSREYKRRLAEERATKDCELLVCSHELRRS